MTITLPTTACRRADRASRLAHRRGPVSEAVTVRLPVPRVSTENLGPARVATRPAEPHRRRIARNAARDDEMAAQGLVFVTESASLRARASHLVAGIEAGGSVDHAAIEAVLRAFGSYDPFLGGGDRTLNVAARRSLVAAVRRAG